ncbi:hypothetical protein YC2023_063118 [Brassica napus]
MKRVMTTASMCTPHIATMRPDMNRVCYINQTFSQTRYFVHLVSWVAGADVARRRQSAELQHKTCQRAPVIVNACYLQELIRHRKLLMECVEKSIKP